MRSELEALLARHRNLDGADPLYMRMVSTDDVRWLIVELRPGDPDAHSTSIRRLIAAESMLADALCRVQNLEQHLGDWKRRAGDAERRHVEARQEIHDMAVRRPLFTASQQQLISDEVDAASEDYSLYPPSTPLTDDELEAASMDRDAAAAIREVQK